jgi:hypothetical protein
MIGGSITSMDVNNIIGVRDSNTNLPSTAQGATIALGDIICIDSSVSSGTPALTLPQSPSFGAEILVVNNTGAAFNVFPYFGDIILNVGSTNLPLSIPSQKCVIFTSVRYAAGRNQWAALLSA